MSAAGSPRSHDTRAPGPLKRLVEALALALVLPAFGIYRLARRWLGADVFQAWSQTLALIPGRTGSYLRQAFYRLSLDHCGTEVRVSFGTVLTSEQTTLGDRVYVGLGVILGAVTIEDDVLIASQASILNGARQHGLERLDQPIRDQAGQWPRIRIGRGAWIGERAVVMADVGAGSVVGAGAVVTRPVPAQVVVAGVPARMLRQRSDTPTGERQPAAEPMDGPIRGAIRR